MAPLPLAQFPPCHVLDQDGLFPTSLAVEPKCEMFRTWSRLSPYLLIPEFTRWVELVDEAYACAASLAIIFAQLY